MTPALLCAVGVAFGLVWLFVFNLAAKLMRPALDVGRHWERMAHFSGWTAALVLVSGGLESVWGGFWFTGWHLHLDRALPASLPTEVSLLAAFGIPFLAWALAVPVSALVLRPPGDEENGLAGALGHLSVGGSLPQRRWVLLFAIPVLLVLVGAFADLGTGLQAFPAAAWSTSLVAFLSLIGVALSRGRRPPRSSDEDAVDEPAPLVMRPPTPWPSSMKRKGFDLQHLCTWSASAFPGGAWTARRFPSGREPDREGIAPELVTVLERLIGHGQRGRRGQDQLLVLGPDDCGQREVIAEAAVQLADPMRLKTLIIAPGNATAVGVRLRSLLPSDVQLSVVEKDAPLPESGQVWVVDAEVLAGRMGTLMKRGDLLPRVGLLVWWNVEVYTGVLAANMWAVSRRLQRFVERRGRPDIRILVLARSSLHAEDQHLRFIRRLLPYNYGAEDIFPIELRFSRELHLHRIRGFEEFVADQGSRQVDNALVHPAAMGALASLEISWDTYLAALGDFTVEELGKLQKLYPRDREGPMGQLVAPALSEAGAQLIQLRTDNVLALKEMVASGGRASRVPGPHHVATPPSYNPYANYVLDQLGGTGRAGGQLPTSRWLVGAEGQERILRQHLREALAELPDTRRALQETFLLRDEVIARTLDGLKGETRLDQKEVRYLDAEQRMQPDQFYTVHGGDAAHWQPLTTVGTRLVKVVAPDEAQVRGGLRMWVDHERLPIQAYPGRVFMSHDGLRYRVQDWGSFEDLERQNTEPFSVLCKQEGRRCRTFRVRTTLVDDLEPTNDMQALRLHKGSVARWRVKLLYEEIFRGRVEFNPAFPDLIREQHRDINTSFDTTGLLLRFDHDASYVERTSLAEALRHVIPVHVGVEADAMELVVVDGVSLDGQDVSGIVVVDLFPGGIGLSRTLDDAGLLIGILEACRAWLSRCLCRGDKGCERCLHPVSSLATADGHQTKGAALNLLDKHMV